MDSFTPLYIARLSLSLLCYYSLITRCHPFLILPDFTPPIIIVASFYLSSLQVFVREVRSELRNRIVQGFYDYPPSFLPLILVSQRFQFSKFHTPYIPPLLMHIGILPAEWSMHVTWLDIVALIGCRRFPLIAFCQQLEAYSKISLTVYSMYNLLAVLSRSLSPSRIHRTNLRS